MIGFPQSIGARILLKVYLSSDHVSAATGKTVAITISKNGGAFGNPSAGATNATEISNGWYYVDLSTTDLGTTGPIAVRGTAASCDDAEWHDYVVNANNAGLAALPNAAAEAAGGLYTRGTGAGQINQPANGQIDANAVKVGGTTQTGRDLGASVLISSGTGTGQLDVTSGVIKANLAQILGTALTETAGQIAAAFKQFFDVSSPTGTMKAITAVTTVTNLTNAPTSGDLTATMKTSVTTAATAATPTVTLAAAAVTAIWDALTSALTTVGSIGKLVVDNVNATISGIPTANQNADALLDRTAGIETGITMRQGLRGILAMALGKLSGAATTTVSIRDTADSKNRIVATVDANGNRSAVTLDLT